MNAIDVLRQTLASSMMVVNKYLDDLSDEELLLRPAPGLNRLAWQVGHLISSEAQLLEMVRPGSGPNLPAGFAEAHATSETGSDDTSKLLTKNEYLKLWAEVQQSTSALLDTLSESDLDAPGPEKWRKFFPTVGSIMVLVATHPLMHSGQWVPLRRSLQKPIVI